MQRYPESFHIEKHLLSLWQCGCYINTQNIINLSSSLGIELPFKKRTFLMQTHLLHVKETKQEQDFLSLICDLLDKKAKNLQENITLYPKTGLFLQQYLHKIAKTQSLLTQELALHVKEKHA